MKELTYEDWVKNPTPRNMWVWDANEKDKEQRKVVYILKAGNYEYPVLVAVDECRYENYSHCAEIEKPRTRRMTNQELARWLREKPTREYKYSNYISNTVYSSYTYIEDYEDEEVHKDIVIRENDGEWQEPLIKEV